jgi:hypothetical protein
MTGQMTDCVLLLSICAAVAAGWTPGCCHVAAAVGWMTDSACYYLFALATMGVTIVCWEREED